MSKNPLSNSKNVYLIDPNKVNDSESGLLKPEDMFMFVDLEVTRKPRTIITTEDVDNDTNKTLHVSFVSNSKNGGSDPLTTNYTRQTTFTSDDQIDPESFGIENISIEFNSGFAPMIKIDFVDVRGSSLFERGNDSKYNFFFNLPYPMFKLTVKGYYGPAVSYCLHLLKFNSKFNSDTGNFEITCEFIGYTFAFLSDILLGYLRAVPETTLGEKYFIEKQAKDPQLITLNKLIVLLNEARTNLGKLTPSDNNVLALESAKKILDFYNEYENDLNEFIRTLTNDSNIVALSKNKKNDKIIKTHFYVFNGDIGSKIEIIKKKYFKRLNNRAKLSNREIEDSKYKLIEDIKDNVLIKKEFKKGDEENITFKNGQFDRYNSIKDVLNDNTTYIIADFYEIYNDINLKRVEVTERIQELSLNITDKISSTIKSAIGFKPTIRNFTKLLTAHIEVFLKVIKETSKNAMLDDDKSRVTLLSNLAENSLDISDDDIDKEIFYPWPEYSENNEEKWVGSAIDGVIPETNLVEEFLTGLLNSKQLDNQYFNSLYGRKIGIMPSNIFDLNIYRSIKPYDELLKDTNYLKGDIKRLFTVITTRLFNFGHTNVGNINNYQPKFENIFEIFGKYEANELFKSLQTYDRNKNIVNSLKLFENNDVNKQVDEIIKLMTKGDASIMLPNNNQKVIEKDGDMYAYTYVSVSENNKSLVYLPNFSNFSKLKEFYNGNKFKSFTKIKESFQEYNNKYPQYSLHGKLISGVIDDGSKYFDLLDVGNLGNTDNPPELSALSTYKKNGEIDGSIVKLSEISKKPTNDRYDNGKSYIFNSPTKINDLSKIEVNNADTGRGLKIEEGEQVPSSLFFYTEGKSIVGSTDNYEYSICPIGIFYTTDNSLLGPSYIVNNKTEEGEFFSPLCYTIDDLKTTVRGKQLINYDGQTIDDNEGYDEPYVADETIDIITNIEEPTIEPSSTYVRTYSIDEYIDYEVTNKTDETIKKMFSVHAERFAELTGTDEELKERFGELSEDTVKDYIGRNKFFLYQSFINGTLSSNKFSITFPTPWTFGVNKVQLFGSELYLEQMQNSAPLDITRARAYLFLHMTPLLGNINFPTSGKKTRLIDNPEYYQLKSFHNGLIRDNMLSQPGIQRVPYVWILALGSEYWLRDDETNAKIYYTNPEGHSVVAGLENTPYIGSDWLDDKNNVQLSRLGVNIPLVGGGTYNEYDEINNVTLNFKKMCLNEFKEWTKLNAKGSMTWNGLRKTFEIVDFDNITRQEWYDKWVNFKYTKNYIDTAFNNKEEGNYNVFTNKKENRYVYNVIQPYIKNSEDFEFYRIQRYGEYLPANSTEYRYDYNCFLNYTNKEINNRYLEFLTKEKILVKKTQIIDGGKSLPKVYVDEVENFYRGFFTELNELLKNDDIGAEIEGEKKLKNQVFSSIDNDFIKLNIYRHLGSIYNKWIGGSESNWVNPCVFDKNNDGTEDIGLIDRFEFLDRDYKDIGDSLIINPFDIVDHLMGNLNQSFYDLLGSKILAQNNMDFIPLPTYFNFRDGEQMKEMFKTYTYKNNGGLDTIAGPKFICMYVGQSSQHLDLGITQYKNDGVDFTVENNEINNNAEIGIDKADKPMPVVLVSYADQNQSIFKDIKLDQLEFSETEESLTVISDLVDKNKSYNGQNLYNIYSLRSYNAEIEMLGNLTMQPYMYFQLNNIPMFHGAYMIIKVSHEVEAHYVTTKIKGVRIKKAKSPLVTEETLYLNLLNDFIEGDLPTTSISEGNEIPEYSFKDRDSIIINKEDSNNETVIAFNQNIKELIPKFGPSEDSNRKSYQDYGKSYESINTIVVHATDSTTLNSACNTLFKTGNGYHFIIDREGENDGTIIQGTELKKPAYHAGKSYGPQGYSLNGYSIGISLVLRQTGENQTITNNQKESLIKLINKIVDDRKKDGDLKNIEWVTYHVYVSINRKSDIVYLKNELEEIANETNLKVWLPGMKPFPNGLEDCDCIETEIVNDEERCKKIKIGNNCLGPDDLSYFPNLDDYKVIRKTTTDNNSEPEV